MSVTAPHAPHAAISPCPRYAEIDVEGAGGGAPRLVRHPAPADRLLEPSALRVRTCASHTLTVRNVARRDARRATEDFALWHVAAQWAHRRRRRRRRRAAPVAQTLGRRAAAPLIAPPHRATLASRQWDETWVLALTDVRRLFRSRLPLQRRSAAFARRVGPPPRAAAVAEPPRRTPRDCARRRRRRPRAGPSRRPQAARDSGDAARKDAVVERLPRARCRWAGVWGVVELQVDVGGREERRAREDALPAARPLPRGVRRRARLASRSRRAPPPPDRRQARGAARRSRRLGALAPAAKPSGAGRAARSSPASSGSPASRRRDALAAPHLVDVVSSSCSRRSRP